MDSEYDAIIVGAGIAGLGCGGLLAKVGKKVLVVEKNGLVGGRATTFREAGVVRSFGQHIVMKDLHFEKLLKQLEITEPKRAFLEEIFLSFEGKLANLEEVLPLLALRAPDDFAKMGEMLGGTIDLEALDDVSADEWLKEYVQNPLLLSVFFLSGAIMTTIPRIEEMAASAMYETIQIILNHRDIWLAAEGLQDIFEAIKVKIEANAGKVITSFSVEEILIESKRVVGIRAKNVQDGEFLELFAPSVILAIPTWDLLPLISKKPFFKGFEEKVHDLSLRTANIGLTALLPQPLYEGKRLFMVNFPSINYPGSFLMLTNTAPKLARKGQHLFDASIICNYEAVVNNQHLQKQLLSGMRLDLNAWFPNWEENAYWVSSYLHYEEPKRTPGRAGKHRLKNKAEGIDGLYFAGDCYASRALPGLECASESAMMCVKEILERLP